MSQERQAETTRKIIELVQDKMAAIAKNPEEAEYNARLATRAIMEGRSSDAWREYMLQFVEQEPLNADQLARLLAEDDTLLDEAMNRRRAYLLGNAICGGGSPGNTGRLDFGVEGIDNGL